jgi:hypothetical protein
MYPALHGKPDGVITALDQVITGDANPKFVYGFSTTVKYKKFDFAAFFSGVIRRIRSINLSRWVLENPSGGRNVMAGLANRWSTTNPPAITRFLQAARAEGCHCLTVTSKTDLSCVAKIFLLDIHSHRKAFQASGRISARTICLRLPTTQASILK